MTEQSASPWSGLPDVLQRCIVVLCQPADIANVGGVVRVMANFGLSRLRLVDPAAFDPGRIHSIAHRGDHIVAHVERFSSLVEALHDCGLVIGTTARPRTLAQTLLTPHQAATTLLSTAATISPADVALVFGPESNGLSNDDLLRCHATVTIPTAPGFASLNLAQAALVVMYELWQVATSGRPLAEYSSVDSLMLENPIPTPAPPNPLLATVQQLDGEAIASAELCEKMFRAISDVLWSMHPNTDAGRVAQTLMRLRAMLTRAVPATAEVQMVTQLCTHIAHDLHDLRAIEDTEFRRRASWEVDE